MQCAHIQCLKAQKISWLYNLSPINKELLNEKNEHIDEQLNFIIYWNFVACC
jgi:hypothetical protein